MTGMRAKATKKMRRFKRDANAKDFALMVVAASEIVMQNRGREQYRSDNPEYILAEFPHWVTFDKTFPKGQIVAKTVETNTYKINAIRLLDWLYKNGFSSYDSKQLVKQTRMFEVLDKSISRMFNSEGE
jgi:hypothetical protein